MTEPPFPSELGHVSWKFPAAPSVSCDHHAPAHCGTAHLSASPDLDGLCSQLFLPAM